MKTLTAIDFLSSYRDILTDGISVPDYLRPKCIQKFTSVDVVKTYNKLRWLDYGEDDYLEVRTYTYCLDEFMGRSYD